MKTILLVSVMIGGILAIGSGDPGLYIKQDKQQPAVAAQTGEVYYCPMHPDVTSNKPGECPKCGMALVKKTKDSAAKQNGSAGSRKTLEAKKLLGDAKRALGQEGTYKCCIEDGCDRCALDHQSCPCYTDLKAGKPVCPDCYAGWQRGEGKDKNIKPEDVKTKYSGHKH